MAFVSFVFSFYNEAQSLPLLIQRIREVMASEPDNFELIFVNDASTDHSAQVITEEAQKKAQGEIVLVNLSRRFGVEESFLAGIEAAQGDAVILMYTDLQDPPEVVKRMLASWRQGAEIVHTIRRRRIGEHPLKTLAAFWAYRIIGNLSEIKIPYDAGEFKLMSKRVARHLLTLPETEPYLRGLIPWVGFSQAYVEYDMLPREAGRSKIALFGKKAWTVFLNGIISFSDIPVYIILLTGIGGIVLSAAMAILTTSKASVGPAPSMVFIIFLWASLMTALGFIGLYLLKIYKNTRGRPRYIVQETIRFGR